MRICNVTVPDANVVELHEFKSLGLKFAVVKVTKKIADQWLDLRPENQRKIKREQLNKIQHALQKGLWDGRTGESMKFDINGNLIDGQHRLLAISITGLAVSCLVVFNCPQEVINIIDGVKQRSLVDVLQIHGMANVCKMAAIITKYMQIERTGRPISCGLTMIELVRFAESNIELLKEASLHAEKAYQYLPKSIGGGLYMFYRQRSKDGATAMYDEFKKPTARCNAIEKLKEKMTSNFRKRIGKFSVLDITALSIKSFNAYFACKNISNLRWNSQERFPEIEEDEFDDSGA
jgi:hypothetical protein